MAGIFDEKCKEKEKIQGRTNRGMSIFNPTLQLIVVNQYTKFEVSILKVVEISLTKNLERKKKEQTQGRTNRRMSICNPTIQLVVANLYIKPEVSILKVVEISLTKNLERKKKEQI